MLGQLTDPWTHGDITDENIVQQLLSTVTSPWRRGLCHGHRGTEGNWGSEKAFSEVQQKFSINPSFEI